MSIMSYIMPRFVFPPKAPRPEKPEEEATEIQGDRGLPSVNQNVSLNTRASQYIVGAVVIVLVVVGLYKYYSDAFTKADREKEQAQEQSKRKTAGLVVAPLNTGVAPAAPSSNRFGLEAPPAPDLQHAPGSGPQTVPGIDPAHVPQGLEVTPSGQAGQYGPPGQGLQPGQAALLTPEQRKRMGSVMKELKPQGGPSRQPQQQPGAAPGQPGGPSGFVDETMPKQGSVGDMLKPTVTKPVKAALLPNRNFVIAEGTSVDCTLDDAIDSTLSGLVSCTLANDVRSDNGNVVLMERGSTATGEYEGNAKIGQARINILWRRIKTIHGVVIDIASPTSDGLGRSGTGGYVDNRFADRFGAAILLSVIQDISSGAGFGRQVGGSNNQVSFPGASGARDLASEALKTTANLPAVIRKNQGEKIKIFVARDLDFRGVYGLKTN